MLWLFKSKVRIAAFTFFAAHLLFINQPQAEISVIVHPENDSNFDTNTIKKIFLGKSKSFSNGRVAILLSPAGDASTTRSFNKGVLGKSESQYSAYWSKMMFTGKGSPPQEMGSDGEIVSAITANKDAIGFIDSAAVTGSVKVVATF